MSSFIVTGGVDAAAKTLAGDQTGVVDTGATLTGAISWTGGSDSPGVTIDNFGVISTSKRAIDTPSSFTSGSLTLNNHDNAVITSSGADAFRINLDDPNGTIIVDNAGTIQTTGATGSTNGQALDFANVTSTSAHIHIINDATGLITAADADAIRAGQNTTIDNYGQIISHNAAGDSGDDGIDFQGNGGGVVNNKATGDIEGARHGVTGDDAITINNDGIIIGHLGSGVNMDTAATSMSFVTNHGSITGTGGILPAVGSTAAEPTDGDGVDVDGLLTLKNYGAITAAGIHVDGELQEAVTIGGGEIDNYAGGTITSFERAITVDDSNGGAAFGATTTYNEGLIHGGNGQAISITGTFADTITNKGVIEGSIFTGGGNDTFNLYSGSSVTGAIDGGDGTDTVNLYGPGAGTVQTLSNVEILNLFGGGWTLGSEGAGLVNFQGAGELRLEAGLLTDHHFDGQINGLANVDTIDLEGVGLASSAALGSGNILTVSGGTGGPITLQFDPHQSFAGYVFQLSSDGAGGTDVTIAKVINGGNGNDVLAGTVGNDLITGGNGNDTINSGDGNDGLSGGNGNDVLHAGNGNDVLDGGNGDDVLQAGDGGNALTGGNGNDILQSGNGDSTLGGGNGDDVLKVGAGDNRLTGGNGSDSFVFGAVFGQNVITDFHSGDHIEFDGAFGNFQAVQQAMHQVGGNTVIAVDAAHEITLLGVSLASLHASDFIFH